MLIKAQEQSLPQRGRLKCCHSTWNNPNTSARCPQYMPIEAAMTHLGRGGPSL